jgi:hypothetical protein
MTYGLSQVTIGLATTPEGGVVLVVTGGTTLAVSAAVAGEGTLLMADGSAKQKQGKEISENAKQMRGSGDGGGGPKAASKIDRAAFRAEREAFWKAEAKSSPQKYSAENLARMKKGQAPLGPDGHPMELHHVDRSRGRCEADDKD